MNPRTGLIGPVAAPLAGTRHLGDTHGMRRARGQVVVETAIVMPVFVFLILGLLQLGLMHHARVMTKYSAYKAVRAGALNRGEKKDMENAALAVLLPVLGRDSTAGAPYKTDSASAYDTAWAGMRTNKQGTVPFVEVAVCNPQQSQVAPDKDFDDARVARPGNDWKGFNSTKLQIQVTVFYRMYIPFANWMVWRLALGEEEGSPKKQRWLGWKKNANKDPSNPGFKKNPNNPETLKTRLKSLADQKKYIMPIRASYAMRMQSNFSRDGHSNLPSAGGAGTSPDCKIPWARK